MIGADVVRVGIIGVGNCASAFVQGLAYYEVEDVTVASAFDVAPAKLGADVADAVLLAPNNACRFDVDLRPLGVAVRDGADAAAVAHELRSTQTDVVLSLVPVGAQVETEAYAEAALAAGCGFVNCTPAVLARSSTWAARFADARLPLVGDDLKSQFGSTLIHRVILDALQGNGVEITSTYQLNAGGNGDFLALQEPAARAAKQATKSAGLGGAGVASHVGVEHIPHLGDRKTAFIRVDAVGFGGTPIEIDVRMAVEDSASAAGVMLDAVRTAGAALRAGHGGVLHDASARFMKAAPAAT